MFFTHPAIPMLQLQILQNAAAINRQATHLQTIRMLIAVRAIANLKGTTQ